MMEQFDSLEYSIKALVSKVYQINKAINAPDVSIMVTRTGVSVMVNGRYLNGVVDLRYPESAQKLLDAISTKLDELCEEWGESVW